MSRVYKTIKNAKIGLLLFVLNIFVNFLSRKIFLDKLGDDFLGIVSTIRNIIGFLNIADLGIVASISYRLYKPIQEENRLEIQKVMLLFGYFYKRIAIAISLLGFFFLFVIPFLFHQQTVSLTLIYLTYLVTITVSLLGYFFNYHQTLLIADQKDYVVRMYDRIINLAKLICQIALLIIWKNVFAWILLELIFPLLQSYLLRRRITKEYPWLLLNGKFYKETLPDFHQIVKTIKQSFVHRLGGFILNSTDLFFIYIFTSLSMVTLYGNYYLIVQNVNLLIATLLVNIAPGVGNLLSEHNPKKVGQVFSQILSFHFFIASFLSIVLFFIINPFISVWLGNKYLLPISTLALIITVFFLMQIRKAVDVFINGYGLFSDIWAPVIEVAINLTITIIFGKLYGINGVIMGTIISLLLVICLWKPYFLFRKGFDKSVLNYWLEVLPLLSIFFLILFLMIYYLGLNCPVDSYLNFGLFTIKIGLISFVPLILLFAFVNNGFRAVLSRLYAILRFSK